MGTVLQFMTDLALKKKINLFDKAGLEATL